MPSGLVRLRNMDQLLDIAAGQPVSAVHRDIERPAKKGRVWTWILLLIVGFFAYAFVREPSVNEDVLKGLKADVAKCSNQMNLARAQGIVTNLRNSDKNTDVTVEEVRWGNAPHDTKVAIALAAYCLNSPSDGRHTVYIWGLRDGQIKGSVTNGNWFSN